MGEGALVTIAPRWRSITPCHDSYVLPADELYGPPYPWPSYSPKSADAPAAAPRYETIDGFWIGASWPTIRGA